MDKIKINRRGFLSLGLGASAGLTLSPLPWKLLDDLSIWTQNWPWVPIPKSGAVSYHDSTCTLCPGGCGITVRRVDDRVVSVAGRKDHPLNRGGICPLGLSGPQLLYTPTRIMSPMLKVKDSFQPISWNSAISILVTRLGELQAQNKTERLACISGTDQDMLSGLLKHFLGTFGSDGFYHSASLDNTWEILTGKLTGTPFVPGYDLEGADTVFSFGCGLADGWGSPIQTMRVHANWKDRGTKLVQIESRLSNTAATADRWIAITPGTEAEFALAMGGILVEQYSNHIRWQGDYPESRQRILEILKTAPSLDQAARTTGVSRSTIRSLADTFAKSDRPLALAGHDQGRDPENSRKLWSILALNILAGNIDQPGGMKRIGRQSHIDWPTIRHPFSSKRQSSPDELFRSISESNNIPIEILLISDCNPCYSMVAADQIKQAVKKIPLVVTFSEHWNETAMAADLILPNHSHLERYQDVTVYSGLSRPGLGLSQPVSRRLFNTRYTGDIIIETARRLGGATEQAFPWKNYETCLRESLHSRWEELTNQGWISLPDSLKTGSSTITSHVPTVSTRFPGKPEDYPLILLSSSSMRLNSGSTGSSPFMVKSLPETVLQGDTGLVSLNPKTAAPLGIVDGDMAQLVTPEGEVTVMIHLDEGTMPETVVMPRGLGHTALGEYLAGKGANINRLLQPSIDPLTGQQTARGIRARLEPV